MNPLFSELLITEALPEPGAPHVWVSFSNAQSHRIDLTPLLSLAPYQILSMPRVLQRVSLSGDQRHVCWPGGARIDVLSILLAPGGSIPIRPLAVTPATQRYRPLLPFLQHLQPAVYLRPAPIDPLAVQQSLGLSEAELNSLAGNTTVPRELVFNRLHDLGIFLESLFPRTHVHSLIRRDWSYAIRQCPGQPMLHTMLGCLQHHRPDLIERPCMLLATGGL